MASPVVSVIIPYWRGRWAREAVESALGQRGAPTLEVIVCDDGSPEPARDAVGLGDLTIRIIRQRHAGQGAARNHAAACALGDWLAFLDEDDLWDPGKLTRQFAALGGGDAACLYCQYRDIDAGGRVLLERQTWVRPLANPLADLIEANAIATSTAVVRRDAFEAVRGFQAGNDGAEDYALWLALAAAGYGFSYCPDPLVSYRHHEGQDSRQAVRGLTAILRALDRTLDLVLADSADAALIRARRERWIAAGATP
jgi:glycosyltransferase involved in cell wall biosynthesis